MARNIESPGVQINEIDLSFNTSLPVGTNVLVNGFAPQGPTLELVNVTSRSELEQIYGLPTTEAERYFYNSCAEILNSPANLMVNRLPYGAGVGAGFGDNYTGLFYPVSGYTYTEVTTGATGTGLLSAWTTESKVFETSEDASLSPNLIAFTISGITVDEYIEPQNFSVTLSTASVVANFGVAYNIGTNVYFLTSDYQSPTFFDGIIDKNTGDLSLTVPGVSSMADLIVNYDQRVLSATLSSGFLKDRKSVV